MTLTRAYEFVLPPGWGRIDLRGDVVAQVASLVQAFVKEAPAERRAKARGPLRARLEHMAHELAGRGALDLVLPVQSIEGAVLSASFVFLPFEVPPGEDAIEGLVALAATDASARLIEIRDLVALRTSVRIPIRAKELLDNSADLLALMEPADREHIAESPGQGFFSRRVQYIVGRPDRQDDWILVAFSTMEAPTPGSAELCTSLEALFDAIVKSVRFR